MTLKKGTTLDSKTQSTDSGTQSVDSGTLNGAKHLSQQRGLKPPWKPGESGNPLGRPKKALTITSLLRDKLDEKDPKTGETYAQGIVKAMLKNALKDPQVLKELLNRCEGKVTDVVDMQGTSVSITYELVKDVTKTGD